MIRKPHEMVVCQICKEKKKLNEVLSGERVRPSPVEMIHKKCPDWFSEGFICRSDLNRFRTEDIQNLVEKNGRTFNFGTGCHKTSEGAGSALQKCRC